MSADNGSVDMVGGNGRRTQPSVNPAVMQASSDRKRGSTSSTRSQKSSTRIGDWGASMIRSRCTQCRILDRSTCVFTRTEISNYCTYVSTYMLKSLTAGCSPCPVQSVHECICPSFVGTSLALAQWGNYLTKPNTLLNELNPLYQELQPLPIPETNTIH